MRYQWLYSPNEHNVRGRRVRQCHDNWRRCINARWCRYDQNIEVRSTNLWYSNVHACAPSILVAAGHGLAADIAKTEPPENGNGFDAFEFCDLSDSGGPTVHDQQDEGRAQPHMTLPSSPAGAALRPAPPSGVPEEPRQALICTAAPPWAEPASCCPAASRCA